jgi:NDP-sugar pyrophosphorylase family protein
MIRLSDLISNFPLQLPKEIEKEPWKAVEEIKEIIESLIQKLDSEFEVKNGIAIHQTAIIEKGVTMKPPIIVSANCKIGSNSYFREGVFLDESVKIGPSSEIKSSIICNQSAIAHMNYVGNSIIGSRVNFEASSIAANHFNEREEKTIKVKYKGIIQDTGLIKFGALVGDDSKIGANAVLSPGTILAKKSIVKRLELIEQVK